MIDEDKYRLFCDALRRESPLVHCITNYVAMEFNANSLLAAGVSPLMSFCKEELSDLAGISDSLLINTGCIDTIQFAAMEKAAYLAHSAGKPWVLDPVGAGASSFRTSAARSLTVDYRPSVIRCNASELLALSGTKIDSKGVDSTACSTEVIDQATECARQTGCVVSVSGATDVITDGERIEMIFGGSSMMKQITGMGCTASALTAAFLAVCSSDFDAACFAMLLMSKAGEAAALVSDGPGSFRTAFVDALYRQ